MKLLEGLFVPEYAFAAPCYFVARACHLKFEVVAALRVAAASPIAVALG